MAPHDLEWLAFQLRGLSSWVPPHVRAASPTCPSAARRAADGTRGSHYARPRGGTHDATPQPPPSRRLLQIVGRHLAGLLQRAHLRECGALGRTRNALHPTRPGAPPRGPRPRVARGEDRDLVVRRDRPHCLTTRERGPGSPAPPGDSFANARARTLHGQTASLRAAGAMRRRDLRTLPDGGARNTHCAIPRRNPGWSSRRRIQARRLLGESYRRAPGVHARRRASTPCARLLAVVSGLP